MYVGGFGATPPPKRNTGNVVPAPAVPSFWGGSPLAGAPPQGGAPRTGAGGNGSLPGPVFPAPGGPTTTQPGAPGGAPRLPTPPPRSTQPAPVTPSAAPPTMPNFEYGPITMPTGASSVALEQARRARQYLQQRADGDYTAAVAGGAFGSGRSALAAGLQNNNRTAAEISQASDAIFERDIDRQLGVAGQNQDAGLATFQAELDRYLAEMADGTANRRIDEDGRQFDAELEEGGRQFDAGLEEDARQFEARVAEEARQFDNAQDLRRWEVETQRQLQEDLAEMDRELQIELQEGRITAAQYQLELQLAQRRAEIQAQLAAAEAERQAEQLRLDDVVSGGARDPRIPPPVLPPAPNVDDIFNRIRPQIG